MIKRKLLPAPRRAAFTLIELLVVCSIISILAMIALPNFTEALTRSKVAAVQNNLRTTAITFEMYHVDNNRYPLAARWTYAMLWQWPEWIEDQGSDEEHFRTAYPYMFGTHDDLFAAEILKRRGYFDYNDWPGRRDDGRHLSNGFAFFHAPKIIEMVSWGCYWQGMNLDYWEALQEIGGPWTLCSPGPDLREDSPGWIYTPSRGTVGSDWRNYEDAHLFVEYDPTNGSTSNGNIFRSQKNTSGLGIHSQFYE